MFIFWIRLGSLGLIHQRLFSSEGQIIEVTARSGLIRVLPILAVFRIFVNVRSYSRVRRYLYWIVCVGALEIATSLVCFPSVGDLYAPFCLGLFNKNSLAVGDLQVMSLAPFS